MHYYHFVEGYNSVRDLRHIAFFIKMNDLKAVRILLVS